MDTPSAHSMVRSKGANLTLGTEPSRQCSAFPSRMALSRLERVLHLEVEPTDVVNRPHTFQVDAGLADQCLAILPDEPQLEDDICEIPAVVQAPELLAATISGWPVPEDPLAALAANSDARAIVVE